MTKILGKDDLISESNLKRSLVEVPELNGSVWVREMTAEHVIAFKEYIDSLRVDGIKETTLAQDIEIMSTAISFSLCDENGNLLFTDKEDAKKLTRNNLNVLMFLGNTSLSMSGVMLGGDGLTSEVAANLPNSPAKSLLENLPRNSRKRARKS